MRDLPIHGRGAAGNPPNRFRRLSVSREDWGEEDPDPETRLYRDDSRSVLTTNDSPDVGFDVSLNPYRGCEHGCVYCLSGDTPILMADGTTRPLEDVTPGDEIYGTVRRGHYRRYVHTRVLDAWRTRSPAYRITLADGTELVAGENHRLLTRRGWKFVTGAEQGADRRPHLTENDRLLGTGGFAARPEVGEQYRLGYLTGVVRGDGHLASYQYPREGRSHGNQHQFRLALSDGEPLDRTRRYLERLGVRTHRFLFQEATPSTRRLDGIRTSARGQVARIRRFIRRPDRPSSGWARGYLAGIFDAEGSYSSGTLRISNADRELRDWTIRGLSRFGFDAVEEEKRGSDVRTVRVRGGLCEHLDFFHTVDPATGRKRDFTGRALKCGADLRVRSVERLGVRLTMYDLTTETGDFIADGLVSHNCYARPTHEYLGLSAGLDFETRIFVKEDAPTLLREELEAPSWEPQPVAMSGVTDPYQPAERRLGITRGCLEVLAEFRNPVGIVTKSRLVTRDLDLLAELAGHDAARVRVSVTTLDEDLKVKMEPRAPAPGRRLDAVERLSEAGVPVGVLVAPVIPGLTEHEIPRILSAAADAGATHASYVLLRLPHAVSDLFESWLEQHLPDRKEKVLNRVRSTRGGRLNDPRFGSRMSGEGPFARQISEMFEVAARRHGLDGDTGALSTDAFRRPTTGGGQVEMFADRA